MSQIKSYPTPSKIRYRLERIWLRQWFRKLVLFTLVTLILLLFSLFVVISSYDLTKLKTLKQNIFERPELSISKLKINNANSDLVNQINAILQLSFPINSIQLDIKNLQKIINNIDLVETANIRINDIGVLVIDVVERKPVAIFREADQLTLIDIKGFKINNIFSRSDRKDLPLIVGIDGNLNVQEALKIYQILSDNIKEIRGLIRIGKRRWDVILKSNKRIKLPETNPKKSLKKFLNSDLNYLISSNKFSVIDLRFINRIVLRLSLIHIWTLPTSDLV